MTIAHQTTLVAWPSAEMAAQAAQYAYFQRYGIFPLVWRQPYPWSWPVLVPTTTAPRTWTSYGTEWEAS